MSPLYCLLLRHISFVSHSLCSSSFPSSYQRAKSIDRVANADSTESILFRTKRVPFVPTEHLMESDIKCKEEEGAGGGEEEKGGKKERKGKKAN